MIDPGSLFVYGTLMPGHLRWPLLAPYVAAHEPDHAPGQLYDSGHGWPAAVFATHDAPPADPGDERGVTHIPGTVVHLHPASLPDVLTFLDQVEDVEHGLFERVVLRTLGGHRAWAWGHRGPTGHLTRIDAWLDQPEA